MSEHEDPRGNFALRWLTGMIRRFYQPLARRALAHPRTAIWTSLAACLVVIVGGGKLIGFSLFPKADTPHFLITVEMLDGSSLAATDRALQFVEEELRHTPQVLSFFTNLGHGNPDNDDNVASHDGDMSYGDVFVELRRYDPGTTPQVLKQLRDRFKEYPNVRIDVREFKQRLPRSARRSRFA